MLTRPGWLEYAGTVAHRMFSLILQIFCRHCRWYNLFDHNRFQWNLVYLYIFTLQKTFQLIFYWSHCPLKKYIYEASWNSLFSWISTNLVSLSIEHKIFNLINMAISDYFYASYHPLFKFASTNWLVHLGCRCLNVKVIPWTFSSGLYSCFLGLNTAKSEDNYP